jgi:hypothetical protein
MTDLDATDRALLRRCRGCDAQGLRWGARGPVAAGHLAADQSG